MAVRLLTMTMVREESMVVETSVRAKSLDTRGTSDTARMPFISFMDACSSHANLSTPFTPPKILYISPTSERLMISTQQASMRSGSDVSMSEAKLLSISESCKTLRMLQGRGWTSDLAEGLVDLLSQRLLLHLDDQVHNRHIGRGHAEGDACTPDSTSWHGLPRKSIVHVCDTILMRACWPLITSLNVQAAWSQVLRPLAQVFCRLQVGRTYARISANMKHRR